MPEPSIHLDVFRSVFSHRKHNLHVSPPLRLRDRLLHERSDYQPLPKMGHNFRLHRGAYNYQRRCYFINNRLKLSHLNLILTLYSR